MASWRFPAVETKTWIQGLCLRGLPAVPGWCPPCQHRKAGSGVWKGGRDLLPFPAWLSCLWQLQLQQLHPASRWGSLVRGQTQVLQLHPGALLRSCGRREGVGAPSLWCLPSCAHGSSPSHSAVHTIPPGAVPRKGLRVTASRVWQTQVLWGGNSQTYYKDLWGGSFAPGTQQVLNKWDLYSLPKGQNLRCISASLSLLLRPLPYQKFQDREHSANPILQLSLLISRNSPPATSTVTTLAQHHYLLPGLLQLQ